MLTSPAGARPGSARRDWGPQASPQQHVAHGPHWPPALGHWELSAMGEDTGMAEGTVHDHLGQPQADPREFRYCLKCPNYQLVPLGTCTQPTIGLDALFFSTINR